MRIAMLTNNYKPFVGGVPISIERLADGLRMLGHVVYIFAPSYENEEEEEFVIRYKVRQKMTAGGTVVPKLFDLEIERKFRELNFDLIHVHHPMMMGYTALYLSRRYGIPLVFTYHTRYEQYLHYLKIYKALLQRSGTERNRLLKRFEEAVLECGSKKIVPFHNRVFTNACDLVFAPTPMMKDYLTGHGTRAPIAVLPTGLKSECFESEEERSRELRNRYLGDRQYLLCSVSRLEKEKNLEFLLKGMQALKTKMKNCFRLLLIGGGKEEENLKRLARELDLTEDVVFTGCIPQSEIMDYYRASDLFVFASKSETQGIVLLEAMAARLPVVALRASGTADVVQDGVNGFMTQEDTQVFADTISDVLESEELRMRLKSGAYAQAQKYREINIAGAAEKYYESICFNRRRKAAVAYKIG